MGPESWLAAVAAILLLAASLAQGVAWLTASHLWPKVAVVLRGSALAGLAAALALTISGQGQWAASDLRQAALSLALAVVAIQLAAAALSGPAGAGLVADLAASGLGLFAAVVWPGAQPLDCLPRTPLYNLGWGLGLLGTAAAVVAGSAGLALAFRYGCRALGQARSLPGTADLATCLEGATALAVASLGAGLTVGAWWAWRSMGSFSTGDPRQGWLAAAWLCAVISRLAWRLETRPQRSAAIAAMVSAALGLLGVLAAFDVHRLLQT